MPKKPSNSVASVLRRRKKTKFTRSGYQRGGKYEVAGKPGRKQKGGGGGGGGK